ARELISSPFATLEVMVEQLQLLDRLFSSERELLHPLAEDISRSLAVLLPAEYDEGLWEIIENEEALTVSVKAVFEMPVAQVGKKQQALIRGLFSDERNRRALLDIAVPTLLVP